MLPRVLVVDHTAQESGGQLALHRVAALLHGDRADIRALIFDAGPFVDRLRGVGIETVVVPLDAAVNTTSRDRLLSPASLARSLGQAIGFVPRLARAIRGSGAELVVANTLKSAVFTALAAPLAGRRWIWHLHDRIARDYLPGPLVAAMRALAVVGPRAIVVNSEATLATLPAVAKRKATLAYPGLAADAFATGELREGAPVVGIVGRISPTKGQREFLLAAAALAQRHPDLRFEVVGAALFGESDYEADVRALPERLGIADRVEFTGWVSDPAARLRGLTLLVHASPVPEPFGQVVAEAMAAGVPVVAMDAGGVPEMLDPDASAPETAAGSGVRVTRSGILARPGDPDALADAIGIALADASARAARADAARADAQRRFTIEATADAVWSAWAAVRGRRGSEASAR